MGERLGFREMKARLETEYGDRLGLCSAIRSRRGKGTVNATVSYMYTEDHGGLIVCLRHWITDLVKIDEDLGLLWFGDVYPSLTSMKRMKEWFPAAARTSLGTQLVVYKCKGQLELGIPGGAVKEVPVSRAKWFDPHALLGLGGSRGMR